MTGRTLSHYRIVGLLGRGGMGEVYEAEDLRLGRRVALKVLPPGARGDATARARLEREARAASRLDHPNVGVVHEIGETEDGALFVAMALYDGQTLRDVIDEGPLDVGRATNLARQVAEGLRAAHGAGVVHRDVKPSNIVVTTDGTAKVIDFGIATLAGAERLTQTAAVTGSAHYMAPEQARGERADARADVWALGVVLYEMLAGRRPFDGAYAQAVLYQAAHEDPPAVRGLRPDTPEAVASVIDRCLKKEPSARYPDAEHLHDALSFDKPADRTSERGRSLCVGRSSAVWLFVSVVAIAALFVMAWGSNQTGADSLYETGRNELREYLDPSHVASAEGYFREVLAEDFVHAPAWAALAEAEVYSGRLAEDMTLADSARRHAAVARRLDPRGPDGYVSGGLVELWAGSAEAAIERFEMARHLDSTHAGAWRGLGDAYLALDEPAAAVRAFGEAVRRAPDDWGGYNKLGFAHYYQGDYAEAAQAWERASTLSPSNAVPLSNWGAALHELGAFAESEGVFRRLVATEPSTNAYTNLGTSLFYQGLFPEAAAQYERALSRAPRDYETRGYLATSYSQISGREEEARVAFERAASDLRDTDGWDEDPLLVAKLATYLASLGSRDAAQRLIREASTPPPSSVDVMIALATAYARLGDSAAADRWVCRSIQSGLSARLVDRSPDFARLREGPSRWASCAKPSD